MTSAQTEHFAVADAHEHELNGRQREVLDLLVRGKTNGEIASALGMTLDGAKWNVSEILGKLGLATREEAADYWRWRNRHGRRVMRSLRGLAGTAAWKWGAGGVATASAIAVVVGLLAAGGDRRAAPEEFYLEARIDVADRSRGDGVTVPGATPEPPDVATTVSTLRWWAKDGDHARWEIENRKDDGSTETTAVVVDGTWQWVYSGVTHTYSKSAIPELPDGVEIRPLPLGAMIGPAGLPSIRALMEAFRETGDFDFIREAGTATILGRKTTVIEFGPVSRGSTSQWGTPAGGDSNQAAPQPIPESSSGVARIWLDEERMVVMRYEIDDSSVRARAEVVRLDWNTPVAGSRLVFEPPPGASFVDTETGIIPSGHSAGGSITEGGTIWFETPPGFFRVGYAPPQMKAREYQTDFDANNQPTRVFVTFEHTDGAAALAVEQVWSSAPLLLRDEPMERIEVGGAEAFFAGRDGGPGPSPEYVLTTRRGEVHITITAHGLTREEVISVAAGLELVQ
jgi:DNA-binding CsgD family transcriptional regulator